MLLVDLLVIDIDHFRLDLTLKFDLSGVSVHLLTFLRIIGVVHHAWIDSLTVKEAQRLAVRTSVLSVCESFGVETAGLHWFEIAECGLEFGALNAS